MIDWELEFIRFLVEHNVASKVINNEPGGLGVTVHYLIESETPPYSFLSSAFSWGESNEDWNFWNTINQLWLLRIEAVLTSNQSKVDNDRLERISPTENETQTLQAMNGIQLSRYTIILPILMCNSRP